MRVPYLDSNRTEFGVSSCSDEMLYAVMVTAYRAQLQLLCHCNGDAACEQYLTQFEKLCTHHPDAINTRSVMIRSQFLAKEDLLRTKVLRTYKDGFCIWSQELVSKCEIYK